MYQFYMPIREHVSGKKYFQGQKILKKSQAVLPIWPIRLDLIVHIALALKKTM